MRLHIVPLVLLLASCGSLPSGPSLPVGEFYDQVLDPLAEKIANQRVDHELTALPSGGASLATVGSLMNAPVAIIGAALDLLRHANTQDKRSALESRRLPLKQELLALFESRTKPTENGYSVCVEGVERRYSVRGLKFVREANGNRLCETALVHTLPPTL